MVGLIWLVMRADTVVPSVQGFYLLHSNPRFPDDPSSNSYSGAALGYTCIQSAMHGCLPCSYRRGRMQVLETAPRPGPNADPIMVSRSAPARACCKHMQKAIN